MEKQLRPYQEEDAQFLASRKAAACFNEQRTGKTPTAIRACSLVGSRKILIVAPASALPIWAAAYEEWGSCSCTVYPRTATARQHALATWNGALVISYDALKIINRGDNVHGAIRAILKQKPDAVIVDEAHRIKNKKSATAKAIFALRNVSYKLLLTGTPTNKPEDIWSLLHFLFPKTFTSYWKFIETYFKVEEKKDWIRGTTYKDIMGLNNLGKRLMETLLPRIATQRKRKEVMPWLPDKEPATIIKLNLTKLQQKYLEELGAMWETEHVITQGVLDRLIRYRQICLDPQLLQLKGASPKTEWILQYLQDYPERSVLIFSHFTSYLKLLRDVIKEPVGIIIGETPIELRKKYCNDFQQGNIRILLLNIKAGKEALTLDKAEAVIFTDRFPPHTDLQQAEDRFVATTQANKDKLNLVYYLCMKDSYDEQLNSLIESQKSETFIINNFKEYTTRKERTHGNCPTSP